LHSPQAHTETIADLVFAVSPSPSVLGIWPQKE